MNLQSKFGYFIITQTLSIALCKQNRVTDRQTDGWTDRQTDGRRDKQTDNPITRTNFYEKTNSANALLRSRTEGTLTLDFFKQVLF